MKIHLVEGPKKMPPPGVHPFAQGKKKGFVDFQKITATEFFQLVIDGFLDSKLVPSISEPYRDFIKRKTGLDLPPTMEADVLTPLVYGDSILSINPSESSDPADVMEIKPGCFSKIHFYRATFFNRTR